MQEFEGASYESTLALITDLSFMQYIKLVHVLWYDIIFFVKIKISFFQKKILTKILYDNLKNKYFLLLTIGKFEFWPSLGPFF